MWSKHEYELYLGKNFIEVAMTFMIMNDTSLVGEGQVRSWAILQFSNSPISSRVLQNWTHFSNTVPCRPSPV